MEENQLHENPELETPETAKEEEAMETGPWIWVRFGFVAFLLILFYIYNQHHANKALRNKDLLIKELKELRSEKISLESQVTNASKQSEIADKLKETGLKELTTPPIKIEYRKANK